MSGPSPEVTFPIHRGLLVWEGLDPPLIRLGYAEPP